MEKQIKGGEAAPAHSERVRGEFPGKRCGFRFRNVNYGRVKLLWDLAALQLGRARVSSGWVGFLEALCEFCWRLKSPILAEMPRSRPRAGKRGAPWEGWRCLH